MRILEQPTLALLLGVSNVGQAASVAAPGEILVVQDGSVVPATRLSASFLETRGGVRPVGERTNVVAEMFLLSAESP